MDLKKIFTYPYDTELILRKQKSLRRELLARENVSYTEKKIAILGGSTIDDIRNLLEIFLFDAGIRPTFYQSEYNKFYEDAVFCNAELENFHPDIIVVFTSFVNLINLPNFNDAAVKEKLDAEFNRYVQIWESLTEKFSAVIIQNNFDLPFTKSLGSLDAVEIYGLTHFVEELNLRFAEYARCHKNFYLHDLHGLSARLGLDRWHNRFQYYAYKLAMNYDTIPEVALSLAKIIRAVLGKNKKCLVLDLDNTLWGGVIGDDGVENIQIGHETPTAEAFTEFQKYVLDLKRRGIILAVCSKNDFDVAKSGFTHPDSILKFEDFAAFYANWLPKNENLRAIAEELNIGLDSLVFIDDNPAERQLIRETMPEVEAPEINPDDIFSYIRAIEGAGYFEVVTISDDDLKRSDTYRENKQRQIWASTAGSYRADIENFAADSRYITLYGRLSDKFGDNGLISVVIGEKINDELHIILWLMSCRVLKRGMEFAMLDELVKRCGCKKIIGYYFPTKKNKMVSELYKTFGFTLIDDKDGATTWKLSIENYVTKNKFIKIGGGEI